jgi:predicted acylesterase/phospholipase RssA
VRIALRSTAPPTSTATTGPTAVLAHADLLIDGEQAVGDTELLQTVEELKKLKEWWRARQVLARVGDGEKKRQQLAVCLYKDPELRRSESLDEAATRLFNGPPPEPEAIDSVEDAGLAGAIAKRRWELDGREGHLRDALRCYDRSVSMSLQKAAAGERFDPYGHINAAFVRDLLSVRMVSGGRPLHQTVVALREEAAQLRLEVVAALEQQELQTWWDRASLLEALVGLGRFADAAALLEDRVALDTVGDWERESTAKQLLQLAEIDPVATRESIRPILAALLRIDDVPASQLLNIGRRFGVALSGGGFRASLFHLGVLARLADEGLLHQVEVLSTVSGGSILGAAYFASLVSELTSNPDPDVDRRAQLQRFIDSFTAVVAGRNVRMQAIFGVRPMMTTLRRRSLSRTRRLGDVLEQWLLGPLRPDEPLHDLRWLNVVPAGSPLSFSPKRDNWRRAVKVPVVLLNATSLGTGRAWRFTGSWMGEHVSVRDSAFDPVTRLEPLWYDRVHNANLLLRTGEAIAASAGVPGLFPPIRLRRAYCDRTVNLVDGGVYDNQGLSGLLEQDCTDIFVSDASGLIAERPNMRSWAVSVLMRTTSIFRSTARMTNLAQAVDAAGGGSVQDQRTVCLLDGLQPSWIQASGARFRRSPHTDPKSQEVDGTIDASVHRALAQLRTDLDRFTEVECFSLMELGYRIADRALAQTPHPLRQPPEKPFAWTFRVAGGWMQPRSLQAASLAKALKYGQPRFLKWAQPGRREFTRFGGDCA